MSLLSLLRRWFRRALARNLRLSAVERRGQPPRVEYLEDRVVPALGAPAGVGAFQPGAAAWFLRGGAGPGAPDVQPFAYGGAGWVALTGDFDGDGVATAAAFDPATA